LKTTTETIAKEAGVSKNTVKRDGKFAKACDAITSMETNGVITKEEKETIMKKPKSQIIKAADSPTEAKKVVTETKPKPRRQAYEVVVEKFNKLKFDQMKKAVDQIDKIWSAQ